MSGNPTKHGDEWRLIDITEGEMLCTREVIQTITKVAVTCRRREVHREIHNRNHIHPRRQSWFPDHTVGVALRGHPFAINHARPRRAAPTITRERCKIRASLLS